MVERKSGRHILAPALAMIAGVGVAGVGAAQSNPCAARNPCAPRTAIPCGARSANPCAAKNPCAANPCAANPCAAGQAAKVTPELATAIYQELSKRLQEDYAKSGIKAAAGYQDWKRYNAKTYQSATHGERYVNNYANNVARDYGRYDGERVLPVGSILAKDSIIADGDSSGQPGPLFLMEKMPVGFNAASADWKYTLIMPDGSVIGETHGEGSANVTFCAECHAAAGEGQVFFLPEELRVK